VAYLWQRCIVFGCSRGITSLICLFLLVYWLYSGLLRQYKMGSISNYFGGYDSSNSHFAYPVVAILACLYFGCHLYCTNSYRFKTASPSSSTSSLEIIFCMESHSLFHRKTTFSNRCIRSRPSSTDFAHLSRNVRTACMRQKEVGN
jgi:hypothetical protein